MSRLAIMTIAVLFAVVPGTVLSQSPPPMPEPPDKCHIVDPIEDDMIIIDCSPPYEPPPPLTDTEDPAEWPRIVVPVSATQAGFDLALTGGGSSASVPFQVSLIDLETEDVRVSEWGTERCRTFSYARPGTHHRILVERVTRFTNTPVELTLYVPPPTPQDRTEVDNPWLVGRLADTVDLYSLTDAAHASMLSIPWEFIRAEPGHAGYYGLNKGIKIGWISHPWTVLHEYIHAFWQYWGGFPAPCDELNLWTFRRDLANFMLEFKQHDDDGTPNTHEEYRHFYDYLTGDFSWFVSEDGKTGWDLLEEQAFWGADLWNLVFHIAETDIPMLVFGDVERIPPSLRPYWEGVIEPIPMEESISWRDFLVWLFSLNWEDRRLMDRESRLLGRMLVFVDADYWYDYWMQFYEGPTTIPDELRVKVENSDRLAYVAFINTLEDMSCSLLCERLWEHDPGFWHHYASENLIRMIAYEVGPADGVELEGANWTAVEGVLELIPSCDDDFTAARTYIQNAEDLTGLQRDALLAVLRVREDLGEYWYPCSQYGEEVAPSVFTVRADRTWSRGEFDVRQGFVIEE